MCPRQKAGCVTGLLRLALTTALWYFLMYSLLAAIQADRLVWAVFWVYVPINFILGISEEIIKSIWDN